MNHLLLIRDLIDSIVYLYQRRFETAPLRGAIVQTVADNLVEVSSAGRIEIFQLCKNAQSVAPHTMITAYKVGVLNLRRRNNIIITKI